MVYLVLGIVMASFFTTTPIAAPPNLNARIAVGDSHALLIDSAGNLWSFGNNSSGQIGDGSTVSKNSPVMFYSKAWKSRAISVAAGSKQSLALLEDGTVLMWGYGDAAQRTAIPQKATAIAAGGDYCMAILETGEAVCWSDTSSPLPVKIAGGQVLKKVNEIAVGSNDFLILRAGTDGSVYQLRRTKDSWIASKVEIKAKVASSSDASSDTSSNSSSDGPATPLTAISISAGSRFGVALTGSGDVYTWGKNTENGVLGHGTFDNMDYPAEKVNGLSNIQKISAGTDHVIVVGSASNVSGWGNARNKRLDVGKSDPGYALPESLDIRISGIIQFDCGNTWNIAINNADEFFTWGNDQATQKLMLKQTLLKTPTPAIAASLVGDQMMTITWKPEEFYTELAMGFIVTYSKPDGNTGKTQLLPLSTSQITLRGLQPATNYKIVLSILGKTGFEEATPVFIVQTAKAESISSSIESQTAPTASPTSAQTIAGSSSSEPSGAVTEKSMLYSLFRLVLVVLILLASSAAVIAFIYLWKRHSEASRQKVKPIRVNPANQVNPAAQSDEETQRFPEPAGHPEVEDSDMKIVTGRETPHSIVPRLIEDELVESAVSSGEEDDFIIRKPGEFKRRGDS